MTITTTEILPPAESGPATAAELDGRTGCDARYLQERKP
jgi:hypothetical protein